MAKNVKNMKKVKAPQTFYQMLTRDGSVIKGDRADRVAKSVEREQQKLIFDLQAKRDALIETLEASKDISTSNSRDSLNAIDNFNGGDWVAKYQNNCVDLELTNRKLAIAEGNFDILFAEDGERSDA